jgi:type III secretion protein U
VSAKTEQPTPQKLREARRNGNVARSRMLSSAAVTAGGCAGLLMCAPEAAVRLQEWTTSIFTNPSRPLSGVALEGGRILLGWIGPPLLGAFLAAAIAATAMAGMEFRPGLLAPQFERIHPGKGFGRVFSSRQLLDTGKNLLVSCAIAILLAWVLADAARDAFRAPWLEGSRSMLAILDPLQTALVKLCLVVLALGGLDYLLARHRHLADLRMTRDEVKQEYRNNEGDPHHKAKRKALHRALANSGPVGLRKATAVVVNPTHIAVALGYEPGERDAPWIVASGREEEAFAIRREARRQGIPVIKDVQLARSLIHYDVGEEIPEELYRAAAAVLRVAMEGCAS